MYFVEKTYKDMQCKACFFKRWGTYEHPVTPLEPLNYEQALLRKGYCRAWMCPSGEKELFVYFEALQNSIEETQIAKPEDAGNSLKFYERDSSGQPGLEINASSTFNKKQFFVALPDSEKHLSLVNSKMVYNYRYIYDSSGALKRAIITNIDGEVREINYKQ